MTFSLTLIAMLVLIYEQPVYAKNFPMLSPNFSEDSLALDNVYHPELVQFCSYFHYVAFACATLITLLGCYIIIKKSTSHMGNYKYMLLVQTFWFYAFNVIYFLAQPIILFPYFMAYSAGVLKN